MRTTGSKSVAALLCSKQFSSSSLCELRSISLYKYYSTGIRECSTVHCTVVSVIRTRLPCAANAGGGVGPRNERAAVRSGGVDVVPGAPRAAARLLRGTCGWPLSAHHCALLRHQCGSRRREGRSPAAALSARTSETRVRLRDVARRAATRARLAPPHRSSGLRAAGANPLYAVL